MAVALVVSGSPRDPSYCRALARELVGLVEGEAEARSLDLGRPHLEPFRGYDAEYGEEVERALELVREADLFLLVCPIYNGLLSAALKNLFEFVDYKALEGRVAGFVLQSGGAASYLEVHSQLVTLMNYFRIVSNPRAVYTSRGDFDSEYRLVSSKVRSRLQGLVEETLALLAGVPGD